MYHGGADRGWHHGHQQMDIPPPRNSRSRPYRGGYHDHREHDNYGSYEDRNYDGQFVKYPDYCYPEYYEENKSYNEYREPAYNRGGRPKETYYRGSYQRGRGESSRYRGSTPEAPHKKYSQKPFKDNKKLDVYRVKTTTPPQHAEKVIHNSGRTIVTLTPGITEEASESQSSKAESPEQDAKWSQALDKPLQETAKLKSVKKDEENADCMAKEIIKSPSNHKNETLPVSNIKTEITESKKEHLTTVHCNVAFHKNRNRELGKENQDNPKTEPTGKVEEKEMPIPVIPIKRAHSEERDFGSSFEQLEEESFMAKRPCSNQERVEHCSENTFHIPLLDCWGDMPSESSAVSVSTSERENTGSAVNFELPGSAQELRTAFILARKEQIEVGFAQDCKTFAFVASKLLKKDPSIEASVNSALRSSLQEMAGICVQELNNFIDRYDSSVMKN